MAINTDGPKKQGRFLKKNSRILKSVNMVHFNFEEICSHPLVAFDNADRSIIHSRFHDPEQLKNVIKNHGTLDDKVHDPAVPQLGVIFPADFTQDWHNERLNSKRRALGFDDEDEIDFAAVARSRGRVATPATDPNTPTAQTSQTDKAAPESTISRANDPTTSNHEVGQNIVAQMSSPEAMRAPETDGRVAPLTEEDMASAIDKAFSPPNQKSDTNVESGHVKDSFTPLPTDDGDGIMGAEDRAIESWKAKQMMAKENEQILHDLKAQARSEGYQAGFREGEEKGLISGQKTASQVFHKVTDIIKEFEGLKALILENVQKNFYELSQAIGEALLGREFSIRPEAYATMIQRVIKDTIAPNEFKIRMHPETWQKVHDLAITDLDPHLIKDPSIAPGEFRVESSLTVVDVSAKKMVRQLLEKADISLFDDTKAS
jgi:flagellar biosynthesis/type III secretory pathway protein FliH